MTARRDTRQGKNAACAETGSQIRKGPAVETKSASNRGDKYERTESVGHIIEIEDDEQIECQEHEITRTTVHTPKRSRRWDILSYYIVVAATNTGTSTVRRLAIKNFEASTH